MTEFTGIGRAIMITDKYFRLYLKEALGEYDLNAAEGMVLHMMYMKYTDTMAENTASPELQGSTQEEIIKAIHYDKGVMTRTMKSLEEKGFVRRSSNPSDSRSFLFCFTEKGMDFRDTLSDILIKWNIAVTEGIDEEKLREAAAVLESMASRASLFSDVKNHKNNGRY